MTSKKSFHLSANSTTCRGISTSSCTQWSSIHATPKCPREFWRQSARAATSVQGAKPVPETLQVEQEPGDKELVKAPPCVPSQVCPSVCPCVPSHLGLNQCYSRASAGEGPSHTQGSSPRYNHDWELPGAPRTNQVSKNGVMVYF